jgi:DNA-directed RNA polymerase sigma subunit (sigma70/sigma32)
MTQQKPRKNSIPTQVSNLADDPDALIDYENVLREAGLCEISEDSGPTMVSLLAGRMQPREVMSPEEFMLMQERAEDVRIAMKKCLTTRQRDATIERFGFNGSDGATLEEIGDRLGVAKSRAGQLIQRSREILRPRLLCYNTQKTSNLQS